MIIGVTGSSGAGKSTVCEILTKKYNAKTITADEIAKELSKKGTKYLEEIVNEFGHDILLEDGELNRRRLANIIYSDTEKRKKLNECTFKYIKEEIQEQINVSQEEIIAIDAPLLLESELDKECDITVAVISKDREEQIERIIKRDNIDRNHAEARLNAQYPNEFYINNCQYLLINDETLELQIENLISKIKQK